MKLRLSESELLKLIQRVAEQVEEDDNPRLLPVPHYLQSDDSTCGPASLRMVMAFYGLELPEKEIATACGHTYELGCRSEDMSCAAKALGFDVHLKNNSTIEELSKLVNAGAPVIVDWFCGDPPEGHSSVVIGVSDKNIYILDPFLEEMRVVAKEDFRRCWFDFYETPINPNNLYVGQIMVLRPNKDFIKNEENTELSENEKKDYFKGSQFGDEKGENVYEVEKVYDFVKKNKEKYYKSKFPLTKLDHNLEWWHKNYDLSNKKHKSRMMNADTSYPLLVIKEKSGNLSVADGLNRLYKAIKIEKKKTLPVYLIDREDLESMKKVETKENELKERCWKGYTQKGMKTMFGKKYPNCVKKKSKTLKEYFDPLQFIKKNFSKETEGIRDEELKQYEPAIQKLVDIVFKITMRKNKLNHLKGFKVLKVTPEGNGWTVLMKPITPSWWNYNDNKEYQKKLEDFLNEFRQGTEMRYIRGPQYRNFPDKLNFHLWLG